MNNRRQHYRHTFEPHQRFKVQFQSADGMETFAAELVDLSVGGLCAVAEQIESMGSKSWVAVMSLKDEQVRLSVQRVASENRPWHGGFTFLPPADLARRDSQEQVIWKFLFDKQRQQRRWQ